MKPWTTTSEKIDWLATSAKSMIVTGNEIMGHANEIISSGVMSQSELIDLIESVQEKHGEIGKPYDDDSMVMYDQAVTAMQNDVIVALRGALGKAAN